MKQTAVESIIEKINNVKPTEFCSIETIKKWCIEAKEMEKEQTLVDYSCGARDAILNIDFVDAVKYYNETFKK
jgi:hypothetical protein